MAVSRWMAECFATTTQSKHSTHSVRLPGKEVTYTNVLSFPLLSIFITHFSLTTLLQRPLTCTGTLTLDKPMNSGHGGVLDRRGTCFTTMWEKLTKTTETAKTKGEKRIWEKRQARRDKSWQSERGGRAENKRENKMPNFTEEDLDLEYCRQRNCACEGLCTGRRSRIKVVTLPVLVGSLFCQNCVCAHFS